MQLLVIMEVCYILISYDGSPKVLKNINAEKTNVVLIMLLLYVQLHMCPLYHILSDKNSSNKIGEISAW